MLRLTLNLKGRFCALIVAPVFACSFVAAQTPAPAGASSVQAPMAAVADQEQNDGTNEDLNEIALPKVGLPAVDPVSGGVKETPEYISELFQMEWRAGDPIDVFVIRPRGVTKPPVAIFLYGFPVDADRFRSDEFCKTVTRNGVAAIGFNAAMTADRYRNVPLREWFVSDLHDSVVKTAHDVQMIVNYITSRRDLDADHIGIFGQGSGATIAGLAATADPRIKAIDLLDPWGDWPTWAAETKVVSEEERKEFTTPAFLKPLEPLDPVRWLPSLAGRPLKLDDATYETQTPAGAKAKLDASIPAGAVLNRYATRSEFQKNAIEDGKILLWLDEMLKQGSAAGNAWQSASSTHASGSQGGHEHDFRVP